MRALEALFAKNLTVKVDFTNPHDLKYQVDGNFIFYEDDHEGPELVAPLGDTPDDAILELFYMVYQHTKQSPEHAVELIGDGCGDFAELTNWIAALLEEEDGK